jgi:hypothetical protein
MNTPSRGSAIGRHIGNSTPEIRRHRRWNEKPRRARVLAPPSDDEGSDSGEEPTGDNTIHCAINFNQYEISSDEDSSDDEEVKPSAFSEQSAVEILREQNSDEENEDSA